MALDGSIVAAIVTGIAALLAALSTAWMSGWNEHRTQARANKKTLARHSVPLIIAAWDLANWFFDILDEGNYSPKRCAAYGDGWNSEFTSYLIGSYFAGVHIIREMTHFFAHITGKEAENLKKLLWKIQDEFISMNAEGRESREMRWSEGDMLAAQEQLTRAVEHKGTETTEITRELRVIGWTEFQKMYKPASESKDGDSPGLHKLFEWYEDEFQRIVYRRFRSLYTSKWSPELNPQAYETKRDQIIHQEGGQKTELERKRLQEARDHDDVKKVDKMTLKESFEYEQKLKKLDDEEKSIATEHLQYPQFNVIVPDHRVRRLQHLLMDLVTALDAFTTVKLNRPDRRCTMRTENSVPIESSNPLDLMSGDRIPCDCSSLDCNPKQEDLPGRHLSREKPTNQPAGREPPKPSRDHQIESRVPPTRTGVVDAEKGISQ
jgi:hypothetical protein